MSAFEIRPIALADNESIAAVTRKVLLDLGVPKVGTAYADPELDQMYQAYLRPGCQYWVAEGPQGIVGGCGTAPLKDADPGICELQKMYLDPAARGHRLGIRLLEVNLNFAREWGYDKMYIETMTYMEAAQNLYRKYGFEYLDGPLGNTGHYSCPVQMIKHL